jgi:hypothetical protein
MELGDTPFEVGFWNAGHFAWAAESRQSTIRIIGEPESRLPSSPSTILTGYPGRGFGISLEEIRESWQHAGRLRKKSPAGTKKSERSPHRSA